MKMCKKCGEAMRVEKMSPISPAEDVLKCECGYKAYRYEGEIEEKKEDKKLN
jgi:hypothetical protein